MMLQRAASNAYSWWWASHIRTKQSKWLEQNLQDIEEKVQYVLKLLQEDGDSFAKRAEMYYKKRPELISFVEEAYRAYRALAERYDHISTELQNANTTIASVFPDRVPQFALDDDDDDSSMPRHGKKQPSSTSKIQTPNIPKLPAKDFKNIVTSATKKLQPRKSMKITGSVIKPAKTSGLSKDEATREIDKLQKEILALQTEKEFVKSSYESGLEKYWEFEKHIKENQERICDLQDEFGESIVIEDDEARRVMAETAIKSCQQKLSELQEKQERSLEEAKEEHARIRESRQKLKSLSGHFLGDENPFMKDEPDSSEGELERNMNNIMQKQKDLESVKEDINKEFETGINASFTVTEMAEKIDELVNKVISLETAVSSQTSLLQRLRTETNDLQTQIDNLEDDKAILVDDKNDLKNKLKEMEEKLKNIQDLDESVTDQNIKLQSHFTEACCDIDHLSVKLNSVKPDEETKESALKLNSEREPEKDVKYVGGSDKQEGKVVDVEASDTGSARTLKHTTLDDFDIQEINLDANGGSELAPGGRKGIEEAVFAEYMQEATDSRLQLDGGLDSLPGTQISLEKADSDPSSVPEKQISSEKEDSVQDSILGLQIPCEQLESVSNSEAQEAKEEKEDEPDWKQMFMNGMENREKLLLSEYTTVLRNFKDVKKKLTETETRLKNANAMKDDEVRSLREKLILLQKSLGDANDLIEFRAMVSQENNALGVMVLDRRESMSPTEERFRMSIDELLEENLDFWLRFSTSFGQIQKFDNSIEDLHAEISKLEDLRKTDGSSTARYAVRSDLRPIYRHFREIQTDLNVWLEKGASLKDELKFRFESLCNIQEEITKALKASAEGDDFKFTSYQAAKFQGEILNMKQENNKVADELQAGLDHITTLQLEVEKTLVKLSEEYALSGPLDSNQLQHSDSKTRVPLRSFIFGSKQKKQKPSIFSCMHPSVLRKIKNTSP